MLITSLAAAAAPGQSDPPLLGSGDHTYRWVDGWARLPDGSDLGNTHGCTVVDSRGRIYFNTDTERAVCIFEPDGTFVGSWGAEWKGGLHGMTIRREADGEYLYIAHTGRGEVAKTTLAGEVIWTLGYPAEAGIYDEGKGYRPTGVAVGPDGSIYVADGYGLSWVHQFDAERHYVRSWGGRGTEPGQFQTPHGIWLDTRGSKPRLVVADRENHRLQVFDLDGTLLAVVSGIFRRPCSMYQHGDDLVVADLAGRITLLDTQYCLIAQLGDNPDPALRAQNGVPREQWRPGEFIAPHSACFDPAGNLYVMDWLALGRVTKLEHVAAPAK